jgi:hypothetical protein
VDRLKAFGFWRWCGFLKSCGDTAKPVLLLNLDETSVKLAPCPRKGWVIASYREERLALLGRGDGSSLRARRSAISLVSIVADNDEAQKMLPHVFVSNEHVLSLDNLGELNATSPDNIFFIRRQSSWVNAEAMVDILKVLAASLGTFMTSHRVVLCMDTCPAHLRTEVLQACSRLGIFLLFVPAGMTAWLQPLDIHVFKRYKDWVVRGLERKRLAADTGSSLSSAEVVRVYAAGITAVIEGNSWARAFDLAGLRGQSNLSQKLLRRLGFDGPMSVLPAFPSAADLLATFPRRRRIPVDELFELPLRWTMPEMPVLVLPKRARLTGKSRPPPVLPPAL